eukprot:TRINITY_DN19259_c0_g1_i1.p1 TRINITY_DN19259_c0_g1~~TRINITY_DN19259_c0_g1_i1.p1  ORF type:complete len:994 (+),score=145.45 TRINITY_DN19259_c0_g1_i1:105-3086(+)
MSWRTGRGKAQGLFAKSISDLPKWLNLPLLQDVARKRHSRAAAQKRISWQQVVCPALERFYGAHGNLLVPLRYVAPGGLRLGRAVYDMRRKDRFIKGKPQRLEWLRQRGWGQPITPPAPPPPSLLMPPRPPLLQRLQRVWTASSRRGRSATGRSEQRKGAAGGEEPVPPLGGYGRDKPAARARAALRRRVKDRPAKADAWQRLQAALQHYHDQHGHLNVPQRYATPDGLALGRVVQGMRLKGTHLKDRPERVEWLSRMAPTASNAIAPQQTAEPKRRQEGKYWAEVLLPALQRYGQQHGHLNVPQRYVASDGLALGRVVQGMRLKGTHLKDRPERAEWASRIGFTIERRKQTASQERLEGVVQPALLCFYKQHGHLGVPWKYVTPEGLHLGRVVRGMRCKGDYLKRNPALLEWLSERGWHHQPLKAPPVPKTLGATVTAQWDDAVYPAFKYFYSQHGHLRVPAAWVVPSDAAGVPPSGQGLPLGRIRRNIITHGHFIKGAPERLAWLEQHGWRGRIVSANVTVVRKALEYFFAVHGHLGVPQRWRVPQTAEIAEELRGLRLGKVVEDMRSRGDYVQGHPELLAWLEEHGWNARDPQTPPTQSAERWEQVIKPALQAFFATQGHLDVPQRHVSPDGVRLGATVHSMRSKGAYLNVDGGKERLEWLRSMGWDNQSPAVKVHRRGETRMRLRWEELQRALVHYSERHGHLAVPQHYVDADGLPLGRAVNSMRTHGTHLKDKVDRAQWLESMGWKAELPWESTLQPALQGFHEQHGHLQVPRMHVTTDGLALGRVVYDMRTKGTHLNSERLRWLEDRGWTAPPRWDLQPELERFFVQHGHLRVPQRYVTPEGLRLGQKVRYLRTTDFKAFPDRLEWLEERGWSEEENGEGTRDQQQRWADVLLPALSQYYAEHGHLNVPQRHVTADGIRLGRAVRSMRTKGTHLKGRPERERWLRAIWLDGVAMTKLMRRTVKRAATSLSGSTAASSARGCTSRAYA